MTKIIIMLTTAKYAESEAKKHQGKNVGLFNKYVEIINRYNSGEIRSFFDEPNSDYSILNARSVP